jgi:hypothetical protein
MRRTAEVTISSEDPNNRDAGKTFLLTEMSAAKAEKWAARALLALTNAGIEVPEELENAGIAAIAMMGVQALSGLSFNQAEPLMDEMFECIQIKEPAITRRLTEDDIEEISTRLFLRGEVLSLHLGFSLAARLSVLRAEMTQRRTDSLSTPTSPEPLVQ